MASDYGDHVLSLTESSSLAEPGSRRVGMTSAAYDQEERGQVLMTANTHAKDWTHLGLETIRR